MDNIDIWESCWQPQIWIRGTFIVLIAGLHSCQGQQLSSNSDYQACILSPSDCTQLSIVGSSLTGTLPTELGTLTALTTLSFDENSLSGTLPAELGSLTGLTSISVYQNSFIGSLPAQLGDLTALKTMTLSSNCMTGMLPTELGSLTSLLNLCALYPLLLEAWEPCYWYICEMPLVGRQLWTARRDETLRDNWAVG
ncbi:hypothetical protein CYMTET_29639 [Cymbomonas tetramitiformis]|uniref:L domain-like protein n=1 Tax=Cymbomonas tetramitiformis TaxID=36881 RepID=A0AAE0KUZ0_9CHLO|nr:hypothetical protein CYMTET_29639 [Cymbomonas tetramitiformis]